SLSPGFAENLKLSTSPGRPIRPSTTLGIEMCCAWAAVSLGSRSGTLGASASDRPGRGKDREDNDPLLELTPMALVCVEAIILTSLAVESRNLEEVPPGFVKSISTLRLDRD